MFKIVFFMVGKPDEKLALMVLARDGAGAVHEVLMRYPDAVVCEYPAYVALANDYVVRDCEEFA